LKRASETYRGTTRKIQGECEVGILAYVPDFRKRDLDNILKPILDCLVDGHYIDDDSLIQRLQIERREKTKGGLIIVYVKEWK
jgi:crossover junction endodeoxyribonuclease RusA